MAVKASASVTLSTIRDLQSCTRYYLLQSSTASAPSKPTANPPGGSWVTAEPSYASGSTNSLYLVDLNVFTDGSFAYSDVSLSSSYEAAKAAYNKAVTAQTMATSVDTAFKRVVRIEDDGLHVGDNQTSAEVLIDSYGVHPKINGAIYSTFSANYVQFGNYQLRRSSEGGLVFKFA